MTEIEQERISKAKYLLNHTKNDILETKSAINELSQTELSIREELPQLKEELHFIQQTIEEKIKELNQITNQSAMLRNEIIKQKQLLVGLGIRFDLSFHSSSSSSTSRASFTV